MTTIGRYEIIDQIGSGSMGTVYRARDPVLDRLVALKTIRTGTDVEPELRERFYREARACARLHHPNIITVYDLGEAGQNAYIAMELLEGNDFRKMIEQRMNISVAVKLTVMAQVCDALAYAHRRGIIHRDIKPSNLFFGGDQCATVLDFGIARLPSSKLTVAGKILGTPNYMAPEQILSQPTDNRSDLFSAAIVFFEMLVYAHPFKSKVIPRRIVESEPDSLFDHDAKLPVLLENIFLKALAKEAGKRYQRGEEFAADLRAVVDYLRENPRPAIIPLKELPSERMISTARQETRTISANLALLRPPPPGEDPFEWRVSEILRLIPEFDDAVDAGDSAAARKLLEQLEAIEAVDSRFAEAVENCRERLQGGDEPPTSPKPCLKCNTPNRSKAQFCIGCGASFAPPAVVDVGATEIFRPGATAPVRPDPQPQAHQPPQAAELSLLEIARSTFPRLVEPSFWRDYSAWTPHVQIVVAGVAGAALVLLILAIVLIT